MKVPGPIGGSGKVVYLVIYIYVECMETSVKVQEPPGSAIPKILRSEEYST
jgi:hypothetical protein